MFRYASRRRYASYARTLLAFRHYFHYDISYAATPPVARLKAYAADTLMMSLFRYFRLFHAASIFFAADSCRHCSAFDAATPLRDYFRRHFTLFAFFR